MILGTRKMQRRYGQTTCLLSKLLEPDSTGARLHASDADPAVWDVLEENLQRHGCHATVPGTSDVMASPMGFPRGAGFCFSFRWFAAPLARAA